MNEAGVGELNIGLYYMGTRSRAGVGYRGSNFRLKTFARSVVSREVDLVDRET